MRVLGVDPGLTRCGLGVVEGRAGRPLRMVAVGVVRTPVSDDPQERLLSLQTEIDQWLADHRPDAVAVERVFAKANIKGIMGTAQASAVPMLAAARLGLPLALYTPTEVKASVSGNGRADKAQVTAMITRILGLDIAPRPADAADALALAICHVWRGGAADRRHAAAASDLMVRAQRQAAAASPNRLTQLHAEARAAQHAMSSGAGAAGVAGRRVLPRTTGPDRLPPNGPHPNSPRPIGPHGERPSAPHSERPSPPGENGTAR